MSLLPNLLRSLFITSVFSFVTPTILIGVLWLALSIISLIPNVESLSQVGLIQLIHILEVFGSGDLVMGLAVIGLVCSLVGVLFDTYTFYRYQKLNG